MCKKLIVYIFRSPLITNILVMFGITMFMNLICDKSVQLSHVFEHIRLYHR